MSLCKSQSRCSKLTRSVRMCRHGSLNSLLVSCIATYYFILIVVAVVKGNVETNQSFSNHKFTGGDAEEFKLTKLLNIEVGGGHEKLMDTDLRDTILLEVKKGIRDELRSSVEPGEPSHIPLENYSQKELATVLKGLYAEISALKKNMSDLATYPSSECLISSDIYQGKSYPIGVNFHRLCPPNALNKEDTSKKYYPRSCKEIHEKGNNSSGVYQIQPKTSQKPFMVLCDMETKGGGWTHIQKRYDGSVEFFLGWREYKFGFGDLESEFWIGLENIYKMTGFEVNELLVEVVDRENKTVYAHYKAFSIGSEAEGYPLNTLRGFSGDAGDALTYHLNNKFSTKDFDQDQDSRHCADVMSGAWWYKNCHQSSLNGKYINAVLVKQYIPKGIHWSTYKKDYCLAKSRMLVRPIG